MNKAVVVDSSPMAGNMIAERPWYKKVKKTTWFKAGLILLATLVFGGFVENQILNHHGAYRFSKFIVTLIRTTENQGDTKGFGILWGASLAIGIAAYTVRQKIRDLYGIVEILIGSLATAWTSFTLGKITGPADVILLSQGLALSGGIYIVVRGVDNFISDIKRTTVKKQITVVEADELKARLAEVEQELRSFRNELQALPPAHSKPS